MENGLDQIRVGVLDTATLVRADSLVVGAVGADRVDDGQAVLLAEPKVIGHQHDLGQDESVDETDAELRKGNLVLRQDDVLVRLKEREHRPEVSEHRCEPCELMQGLGLQSWLQVTHAAFPRSPGHI